MTRQGDGKRNGKILQVIRVFYFSGMTTLCRVDSDDDDDPLYVPCRGDTMKSPIIISSSLPSSFQTLSPSSASKLKVSLFGGELQEKTGNNSSSDESIDLNTVTCIDDNDARKNEEEEKEGETRKKRKRQKRVMDATRTSSSSSGDDALLLIERAASPKELEQTSGDEWTGEKDSVFRLLPRDVLFYMMNVVWTPDMWFATLLVCRRWSAIGTAAFNPFQTAKSLLHGVFVNHAHLGRLAQSPRLPDTVLELPLLEAICLRVKDETALDIFIGKGIQCQVQWMTCARAALKRGNAPAVQCLLRHWRKETWCLGQRDAQRLMELACERQNDAVIKSLLHHKPCVSRMRRVLASEDFALWCCYMDLSVALLTLLDEEAFRSPANMLHILHYSLGCKIEALVYKVFALGGLDPMLYGNRALKEACRRGWASVARVLTMTTPTKHSVSPALENQTPLRLAIINGHEEIVHILLEHPETNPGHQRNAPVRDAIEQAAGESIALHLVRDVRVDVHDSSDALDSVLCMAIYHNYMSGAFVTHLLAELGMDPNEYAHAPLRLALEVNNYAAIRSLIADERIALDKSEVYAMLAVLGDLPACSDIVDTLMHSRRFSHHFDYRCHREPNNDDDSVYAKRQRI